MPGVFDATEVTAMAAAFDRIHAQASALGRSWRHRNVHFRLADDAALGSVHADAESVQPLAIVFFDRSLVVLAWCELRQDYRSFRIDRINKMTITDRSFRPRRVAMLREYLDRLEQTYPGD